MKRFFLIIGIIGVFIGGERAYHTISDGFENHKITSKLPFNPAYEISDANQAEVEKALSQKYSYLASGSQSFCFVSRDGKYVIKFFKHARWRDRPYDIFWSASHKNLLREKRNHAREATFESCVSAYCDFKKETGLIYIHLNTSDHLKQSVKIRDRLGRKHFIDLDQTDFVIQRRAIPTSLRLLDCKAAGNHKKAEETISQLFALIAHRRKLGYNDKDPNLIKNFGFLDNRAVEIDVGGFYIDPVKDYPYFYSHELPKIRRKMMPWISRHYPELIPHIDNEIRLLLENSLVEDRSPN